MSIYSIYRITNLLTNKVYIGFTSDPEQRWAKHCSCSKRKSSKLLYNSIRKHGLENFTFDIIYQSRDLTHTKNIMENYFINEYNSYVGHKNSNGYNMTLGGDGGDTSSSPKYKSGIIRRGNSDWRLKCSISKLGRNLRPQTKEHIQNRVLSRSGKPNIKRLTKEQCVNMARDGDTNGHAKQWCFMSPFNEKFIIQGQFQQFCKEHDLEYSGMKKIAKGGQAKKGKNLGWSVFEL